MNKSDVKKYVNLHATSMPFPQYNNLVIVIAMFFILLLSLPEKPVYVFLYHGEQKLSTRETF